MECPGCGSIIPADSKQCPLCKYLLQTAAAPQGDAPLLALSGGGTEVATKPQMRLRPYAQPYWPLAGLVVSGVVALIVISLLLSSLLQKKSFAPALVPTVTATSALAQAPGTPGHTATATPVPGKGGTPAPGTPTPLPATPLPGTPALGAGTPDVTTPTVTPTPAPVFVTALNCGGGGSGAYLADTDFVGGNAYGTTTPITTANVTNPAPQAVYDTERWGNFTYTLPNLTPGGAYAVRLHFAEIYFKRANQRQFNVSINGQSALTNFDIVAAAGGSDAAVVKEFNTTADAQGQVVIAFTTGAYNNPKCSGIELYQGTLPIA